MDKPVSIDSPHALVEYFYRITDRGMVEATKAELQAANDWLVRYGASLAAEIVKKTVLSGDINSTTTLDQLRLAVHRNAISVRIEHQNAQSIERQQQTQLKQDAHDDNLQALEDFIDDLMAREVIFQSTIDEEIAACQVSEGYVKENALTDRVMRNYFLAVAKNKIAQQHGFTPPHDVEALNKQEDDGPKQQSLKLNDNETSNTDSEAATIVFNNVTSAVVAPSAGSTKCVIAQIENMQIDTRNPQNSYFMAYSEQLPKDIQPFKVMISGKEVVYDGTKPFQGNHLDARFAKHNPRGSKLILSGLCHVKGNLYRARTALALNPTKTYVPGAVSLVTCPSISCEAVVALVWNEALVPARLASSLIDKFSVERTTLKTTDPWCGFMLRAQREDGSWVVSAPRVWKPMSDRSYSYIDLLDNIITFKKEHARADEQLSVQICPFEAIKLAPFCRPRVELVDARDANGQPLTVQGVLALTRHPHFGVSVVSDYLPLPSNAVAPSQGHDNAVAPRTQASQP